MSDKRILHTLYVSFLPPSAIVLSARKYGFLYLARRKSKAPVAMDIESYSLSKRAFGGQKSRLRMRLGTQEREENERGKAERGFVPPTWYIVD